MFCERHEFDVGEAHLPAIFGELDSQVAAAEDAPSGERRQEPRWTS